eukprot:TRINITY_DN1788_c0_g2_i9.p1 TRINITY_DN1788_c0_g2~~TRINITY_DN1788_c0_g2_i9.p1  ORF type:complete len:185 (+),score=51.68 TRINITY_DN1788_c0_g2_i9:126-680(+)
MGSFFDKIASLFTSTKEFKLLIVGLDHAGKSTIVSAMQLGKPCVVQTKPTIGFNLEEFNFKNIKLKMWDISGQIKYRELWKHYYEGADGIVYVLDSTDKERLAEAKEEFLRVMTEQDLKYIRILVFANKQDKAGALREKEIKNTLGITIEYEGKIKVQEASALSYTGLLEGLTWLVGELERIRK